MDRQKKGRRLAGYRPDYVVFDLETTGLSVRKNTIIEIGAVKVSGGKIVDRFSTFVNPKEPIPFQIENLTGISDGMVMDAPEIEEILPEFLEFARDCVLVAHMEEEWDEWKHYKVQSREQRQNYKKY